MTSDSLVQLALNALSCSQKELALRLNVSPTQISKWKKGEYMSTDMEAKLRELSGIGDRHPEFVLSAGSLEDVEKWEKLLRFLANLAAQNAETGYATYRLEDEEEAGLLHWHTFHTLQDMGVEIPKPFPKEIDFDYEYGSDPDGRDESIDELLSNPYVSLIYSIYKSYTDVYGFHAAYVSELIDELDLHDTNASNIEPCLLDLAASKLEEAPDLAKRFQAFKWKVEKDFTEWLTLVKDRAFRAGMPLRAELLDMVHESHDSLGHEAEAESLGINTSRLHPDVYMNELLVSMRINHQVLRAIMKKLGIDKEFELDSSDLRLN